MAGVVRAAGFPVKPLFRNPFGAATPAEFWAKRWNLGYSHMMSLAVGRPLVPWLGKHGSVFAVFVISGLLHELAITLPVRAGYGWPTFYFALHGLWVMAPLDRLPALPGRLVTAASVILPLPLLFPAAFRREVLMPLMEVLP
jgi:alginate O-acetyltransferase complex protein AlgI